MPSSQKQVHTQTFTDGVKTTIARELMPTDSAAYMLNCVTLSQGEGNIGIVTNNKGNLKIPFDLPEGENKCIGTAVNEENNRFYFFIWNSNGFHRIQQYDALTKQITIALENLTDTGEIDIMNLNKDYLILHAEVVRDNLLYWVDGLNNARKTNITKLFDNSDAGYGTTILQEFIDAYKQTSVFAPTAVYFSDTTKPFNRFYGRLTKYAYRYIYDDSEKSTYSDFSSVALPDNEPFTGINSIPTNNNGINITVNTGGRLVKRIEIIMQSTSAERDNESILNWVLVATLDKKKLGLSDYSDYTYPFYNDQNYPVVDPTEVIQPYSFMPKQPKCQSVTKRALTYANGKQGFPVVDIDAGITITYEGLFIDPGVENEFNEPQFLHSFGTPPNDRDTIGGPLESVTLYNGQVTKKSEIRGNVHILTIGNDVKKGNIFRLTHQNGSETYQWEYTATITDSALTVANYFKQKLIDTGRILRKMPETGDNNIYNNEIDGEGNVTFRYIFFNKSQQSFMSASTFVQPVEFDTLKDTGQSIKNIKMGSTFKLGIIYEDFDGRKSLTYTSDALVVGVKPVNDDGIKATKILLEIRHKAPIWARYYQIVRTNDLKYSDFVQGLIQKAVEFQTTDNSNSEYLDLIAESFNTYKKIHPNSTLTFQFEKGDRISLIKKTSDDTYYDFFETEVVDYSATRTDRVSSNLVTNGDTTVTVESASADNVGKFIIVDGSSREILAASGNEYTLNAPLGDTVEKTYLFYDLEDRRATLRIRKPADITIEDNSIVEVYKSTVNNNTDKTFFEFQKKFPIINPGTADAYHGGNIQDQTAVLSALVEIGEGTVYVRNRELPLNNVFPGTQVLISEVEDPSYSDFYESRFNDNGRVNSEDNGQGEVHFGSRIWFSNNSIEDTDINGLNMFPALNREDYNDQYGDIQLTKFDRNRIFVFKELRTAFVPVDYVITQDQNGSALTVGTSKFLNPIQYFAWEGGIGNNPESYASNGTQKYYVSANSGVIIRFGGNGEEPISKTYLLDNEIRELLNNATKNNAKIFGGFDRKNDIYILTIEAYEEAIYFDGLTGWKVSNPLVGAVITYEMVGEPLNGTLDFTSPTQWTYTPDEDYVGSDTWSYRAIVDGEPTQPNNVCLTIIEPPLRNKAWRVKGAGTCVLDEYGLQTGFLGWTVLEEFYTDDETLTGEEKPNVETDADYVSPIYRPDTCTVEPADTTPDAFAFDPIVDAALSTEYESSIETVSGINVPVPISVQAGSSYRINGGPYVTTAGTIENGDTFQVKTTSSNLNGTLKSVPLNISGVVGNFDVTTIGSFGNEFRSQEFRKNDCVDPEVGTLVTTSVNANEYFASTQAAANALADAYIAANGQANANAQGICLMPSVVSLFVVDMYYDNYLDVCAYIDTPGVSQSGNIVARGINFYPSPSLAPDALMLSSDENIFGSLVRRFEFNIAALLVLYPDDVAIPEFIWKIRGRTRGTAGLKEGVYALKFPEQQMGMNGAPGTYVPTVTPSGGPIPTAWSSNAIDGGDGTVGVGVGNVILTFTYVRATNTLTLTTV